MAPRGMITVATVLLCIMLGLLGPAPATCSQMSKTCCTSYNRKQVPFQIIRGYREQTINENCRIEAIIFYTVNKKSICVTRSDEWVRKTLQLLSSKLRRMSKAGSAAPKAPMKKSGGHAINDGSGYFLSTTETFLNNTETFY